MSAGDRFFVDTNLLLYAVDGADPARQRVAREWMDRLWENRSGRLSWQVLHEFYVNTRGTAEARSIVEVFTAWDPVDTTFGLIERAWHWMDEAQVSYWDALIVAAAERAECRYLLSEDFLTGREFSGVLVINPFQEKPREFGLE